MPEVKIDVVAQVGQAVTDLAKVDKALGGVGSATKGAGLSLTDLKSGLDLAMGAYKLVEGAVKSVIDPTVAYAAEVRTLSRTIGATAEESSKLIQAADDVGISAGTLQGALQIAIRKGIKPTIEGMGDLADQYNAIQDPIARTKFLMDNFGRSGAALGALMETGSAGIREAGDAASAMGLVLSQEGVDSARAYEIAIDDAEDSIMSFKLALAQVLLPALVDAADGFTASTQINRIWAQAQEDGIVTAGQWSDVFARISSGQTTAAAELVILNEKIRDHDAALVAAAARLQGLADTYDIVNVSLGEHSGGIETLVGWYSEMEVKASGATGVTDRLAAAQLRFNMIIGGAVGNEMSSYAESQDDIQTQIAETRAELEKYIGMSGQTVTVVTDTEGAQRNLTIAMAGAETAAGTLGVAQKNLSENTDPDKQLQLEAAVARAEQSLGTAQTKVGEWNATLAESGGTYVTNYTTKINQITGELYTLEEAALANAAAHEDATERILFGYLQQALGVDGLTLREIAALTAVAGEWGLLDAATVTAVDGILAAAEDLAAGGSLPAFEDQVNGVRDAVLGVPTEITTTFSVVTVGTPPQYYTPTTTTVEVGAFAHGGAYGGGAMLVGERGPEFMFPSGSGYVMNNTNSTDLVGSLKAIAAALASSAASRAPGATYNYYGASADMAGGYARAAAGAM